MEIGMVDAFINWNRGGKMMGKFIRFLFAIFLVALGVVLILGNLGFETVDTKSAWGMFFPVIFVCLGVMWIFQGIKRRSSIWFLGLLFLAYGGLLLLGRFDVVVFSFGDFWKLWPIILMYAGFALLGQVFFRKKFVYEDKGSYKKFYKKGSAFSVGDYEYTEQNWKVEPMKVKSTAGDFYMDFTKAFIPEEKTPVMIEALAGDIHILMPQNVAFRVHAVVSAGEIKIADQKAGGLGRTLQYETADYDTATRKIDFILKLKAGEIRVDKV